MNSTVKNGCASIILSVLSCAPVTIAQAQASVEIDAEMLARFEERLKKQEERLDRQVAIISEQALQLELQSHILRSAYQTTPQATLYPPASRYEFASPKGRYLLPAVRGSAPRPGVGRGRMIPYDATGQIFAVSDQGPQAGSASDPPPQDGPGRVPEDEGATAERPNSQKQVDVLLLDQGGVLLPKGQFFLEPSLDYTSISSDRVNVSGFSVFDAIVIGTIRVDDIDRDIVSAALTGRYGILNRLQAELRIPAVYRLDRELTGVGTGDVEERRTEAFEIGDVSATLSWQPIAAKGARPATIFRVQAELPTGKSAFQIDRVPVSEDSPEERLVEAPTGSGFFSVTPGVTFVWPVDPVVIFAGGGYTYNFSRTFGEFGVVAPGEGFEYLVGMNLSLNDRLSTNFNFTNRRRFAVTQNDVELLGSGTNDARFGWGLSASLNARMSLVIGASLGLTDESPDFAFSIRLPMKF